MGNLSNIEMEKVVGGASLTASMVTGIISGLKFVYDLGTLAGSTIRRLTTNSLC